MTQYCGVKIRALQDCEQTSPTGLSKRTHLQDALPEQLGPDRQVVIQVESGAFPAQVYQLLPYRGIRHGHLIGD